LLVEARAELDLAKRKAIYAHIQGMLIDDALRLILVFGPCFYFLGDYVRGVQAHPSGWLFLHWLDK